MQSNFEENMNFLTQGSLEEESKRSTLRRNTAMVFLNALVYSEPETKDERRLNRCKWLLETMWDGFPLGRIRTGLYTEGAQHFVFSTVFSKIVGIIAAIFFLVVMGIDFSKFGSGIKFTA